MPRRRATTTMPTTQTELWNRLDPGTAALNDRPFYWLLVTDREAHQLWLGDVPPRVKVALKVLLTEILVLPGRSE